MEYMYKGYYSQGMIIPEPKKSTVFEENQLVYIFPIKRRRGKAILSSAVKTGKNHAAGILSHYANPSLIKTEREVFENALVERHLEK